MEDDEKAPVENNDSHVKEAPEEEMEKDSQDTIFEEFDENEGLAEINFDLVDTGRWLLKVIGGPNHGAEFSMQSNHSYVIGTDPNSCDIVFHDTSVSRQHARINIGSDDKITIEDLKSRNGTIIDGDALKGKKALNPNLVVAIGTTTFIIYDREGEMQTIISPLLPSIVKVLQKEEPKKEEPKKEEVKATQSHAAEEAQKAALMAGVKQEKSPQHTLGAFLLIGIITGLFVIVGVGTATLFKSEPVVISKQVDTTSMLNEALKPFPSVKYSFNNTTGRLLLVGHVLTAVDKNQLMYNLQGLKFIRDIDDTGVVIDEYVWQEINQVLNRTPMWKGITLHSPSPGKFVLSGYLQTRKQAEQLSDYMTANFPYPDLLEKNITVEEDVINSVTSSLQSVGLRDVLVQMSNGEVTLNGGIPGGKQDELNSVIADIKKIPGVRNVKNFVNELAPEQTMINISDKYDVSGFSKQGNNLSVVINGRILSVGDELDGMKITSIRSNAVLLEKDGVQYRIDFSR